MRARTSGSRRHAHTRVSGFRHVGYEESQRDGSIEFQRVEKKDLQVVLSLDCHESQYGVEMVIEVLGTPGMLTTKGSGGIEKGNKMHNVASWHKIELTQQEVEG